MSTRTPDSTGRTHGHEGLRERLAALEHDQWVEWSRHLAARERLSPERVARWRAHWVAYEDLDETVKNDDRLYADRVLALLEELGVLPEGGQPPAQQRAISRNEGHRGDGRA